MRHGPHGLVCACVRLIASSWSQMQLARAPKWAHLKKRCSKERGASSHSRSSRHGSWSLSTAGIMSRTASSMKPLAGRGIGSATAHLCQLIITSVQTGLKTRKVARCLAGQAVGVYLVVDAERFGSRWCAQRVGGSEHPHRLCFRTSQGAFIAARYASTLSTEMNDLAPSFFLTRMSSIFHMLSSATLPLVSLFSGFNFNVLLRKCFADTQIEDLWLPYFCVTTNVTNRRMQVHSLGRFGGM